VILGDRETERRVEGGLDRLLVSKYEIYHLIGRDKRVESRLEPVYLDLCQNLIVFYKIIIQMKSDRQERTVV